MRIKDGRSQTARRPISHQGTSHRLYTACDALPLGSSA